MRTAVLPAQLGRQHVNDYVYVTRIGLFVLPLKKTDGPPIGMCVSACVYAQMAQGFEFSHLHMCVAYARARMHACTWCYVIGPCDETRMPPDGVYVWPCLDRKRHQTL